MTLQKLLSPLRRAVDEYSMISDGDKVAVGLSGGKDSIALLVGLNALQKFYPNHFELIAIHIDMGLKGCDPSERAAVEDLCAQLGVKLVIEKTDIAEIVFDVRKEKNPCSLCAKLRRGALNNVAKREGCNKLALGHHADDLAETLFLSLFYEGRLSTFAPVTLMERSGVTVIRPLIYVEERDVSSFSKNLPVMHNPCPANKHTRREYVKQLLKKLNADIPDAKQRVIGAITHPERNNLFDPAARKNPYDDRQ